MHVLFVIDAFERSYNPGIGSISALLKNAGHTTSVLLISRDLHEDEVLRRLRSPGCSPDLVAVSVATLQWNRVKELTRWIRKCLQIPMILGGYHPTLSPEEVLSHPPVDIICRGEGEHPMLDLVEALQRGAPITQIKNLWVKEGAEGFFKNPSRIFKNDVRPTISNLDRLPYWDREFYLTDPYTDGMKYITTVYQKEDTFPITAGRGCPFSCGFCNNSSLRALYTGKGRYIRTRSVDSLIGEIDYLISRFHVTEFEFWDEHFQVSPDWLENFTEEYRKRGIPFWVALRAEVCRDNVLSFLSMAHCKTVIVGVEHGNEEYRKKFLKKTVTNRELIHAFEKIREFGIGTLSSNMVGLPEETPELARDTIRLNRILKPDLMIFNTWKPLPGTFLYEHALKKGYVIQESLLEGFDSERLSLSQPTMSQEEFKQIIKEMGDFIRELHPDYPCLK